jgi:GntR family transcriptional repressor for pyruvate dehydrogenase complex
MPKLTRVTLADSLLTQLRQQILSGRLSPGRPMPSERELREAFGVGRTTVREALQGLVAAGFVTRRNNQLVVNDPMLLSEHDFDYAALAARLSVEDVYETRKAIECKAVELAARNWAEDDLRLMAGPLAEMRDPVDEETYHRADVEFHSAILEVGKNAVLTNVFETSKHLFFKLAPFWRVFGNPTGAPVRTVGSGWDGHHDIYVAIEARDHELAARLMFELLDRVQVGLVERMATTRPTSEPAAGSPGDGPSPS